jgi:hypothetical protein
LKTSYYASTFAFTASHGQASPPSLSPWDFYTRA